MLRVGAAYAVAAWLLIQIADTTLPLFGFGDTPARIAVIVLIIGFIPTLIIAWVFELTPDGLRKDKDTDRSRASVAISAARFDQIIMLVLVLAVSYFAIDKFVLSESRERSIAAQLVNSESGFQLWSDSQDRVVDDIFVVQEEIARTVAGALSVTLDIDGRNVLPGTGTDSIEAYDTVLAGRALVRSGKPLQAAAYCERATEIDPKTQGLCEQSLWYALRDEPDARYRCVY